LGSRLVLGVFWSAIGAVVSRSLALVAGIVIARLIGKAAFGEYGVIQSTLSMFSAFAMFGVGLTATKHIAEFRRADPERTGRIVGMSYGLAGSAIAVGLLMQVAAGWLREVPGGAPPRRHGRHRGARWSF
jgi:O-antigen/teichoic acid export membrane protein